jgi:hypothetical protein
MNDLKVIVNGKDLTLTDKHYKARGGEGTVFVHNKIAYKIYHDKKKMIPVDKINELQVLDRDNILGPRHIVYDTRNSPIGFTMLFKDNIEFLCKLFVKSFKTNNCISNQDLIDLITEKQKTLEFIHKKQILVVDYNEMNFLVDKNGFKIPYFIDVDSYQTPHFHATALMESVRDRISKNKFNEGTDWFSFAIVTFQLYTGIHPYKGIHPKYSMDEWSKRMDDGISVFDSKVEIPPFIPKFSTVIPKRHLDWYISVFTKSHRSAMPFADEPPIADQIIVTTQVITSKGKFKITLLSTYDSHIKKVYYIQSKRYVLTFNSIYEKEKEVFKFQQPVKKISVELCDVLYESPLIAYVSKNNVHFMTFDKIEVGKIEAEAMMEYNNLIYTISNGLLMENSFEKFGKIIHKANEICNVFNNYTMYQSVVIQDIFGKYHFAIPYKPEHCVNIHIKELDEYRIINAKYKYRFCIVFAEKKGSYDKFIIHFNEEHTSYTVRIEKDVDLDSISFVVRDNDNLCVSIVEDKKVELFFNNIQMKEVKSPPFDSSMNFYFEPFNVLFSDESKLYQMNLGN